MSKKMLFQRRVMMLLLELLSENEINDNVDLFKLSDSFMQSICTENRNKNDKSEFVFCISDDSMCFQIKISVEGEEDITHEIEFHRIT